jgi:hypothetical protein
MLDEMGEGHHNRIQEEVVGEGVEGVNAPIKVEVLDMAEYLGGKNKQLGYCQQKVMDL